MSESPTNRSLVRGIQLLKLIDRLNGATLSQLAREAALPKSTVRRLLLTLQEQRLIRKSLADGLFRTNIFLPLETDNELSPLSWRLCEAAMPVMVELVEKVRWPSDLFVREGCSMRIVESNRANTPISLYRGYINVNVKMLYSAAGRTYLAYCPEAERQQLIEETRHDRPRNMTDAGLERLLERIRQAGYSTRHPGYTGETRPDDGLNAIAVPVMHEQRVLGCINLMCVRDYMTEEQFAEKHLSSLQAAAKQIAQRYSQPAHQS
ncbi:helix-turn-helix domain-containing protein [Aestuariicella sp. G3-2]|uniref:IclR family transcriptional regulator domain-containing protein n=1 Tax=Pseudomaricurvus albidus TaxID=2842452 RepID=UPI001C0B3077|nr:helix-turn-helix domain-containing protein [Aestuariicella albida]